MPRKTRSSLPTGRRSRARRIARTADIMRSRRARIRAHTDRTAWVSEIDPQRTPELAAWSGYAGDVVFTCLEDYRDAEAAEAASWGAHPYLSPWLWLMLRQIRWRRVAPGGRSLCRCAMCRGHRYDGGYLARRDRAEHLRADMREWDPLAVGVDELRAG